MKQGTIYYPEKEFDRIAFKKSIDGYMKYRQDRIKQNAIDCAYSGVWHVATALAYSSAGLHNKAKESFLDAAFEAKKAAAISFLLICHKTKELLFKLDFLGIEHRRLKQTTEGKCKN